MAELIANDNLIGDGTSVRLMLEFDTGDTKRENNLLDDSDKKRSIIQPISELDVKQEKCETVMEKEQNKVEEQTVSPPSAHPPEPKVKWTVGEQCQAVWSEDSKVYAATIMSIDGDQCRVKFDEYGNEEDVLLSTLKNIDVVSKSSREWKPGSRCRAMYSADSLTYPAVVQWVKGQRCSVKFDDYNNEEEMDVSSLLGPYELNGPGRVAKGSCWRSGFGNGSRRRRDGPDTPEKRDEGRERGERESNWKDQQHITWQPKEKNMSQSKGERDTEKLPNQIFPLFPPFPPFDSSGDLPAFIPPPPPLGVFGGKEHSGDLDATSNMLMMWYMCGFHTGSYLAQQKFRSSSKD